MKTQIYSKEGTIGRCKFVSVQYFEPLLTERHWAVCIIQGTQKTLKYVKNIHFVSLLKRTVLRKIRYLYRSSKNRNPVYDWF